MRRSPVWPERCWRIPLPMNEPSERGTPLGLGAPVGDSTGGLLAPRQEPGVASDLVRLGTWNMSGWRAAKVRTVLPEIAVDVLALQETHLAVMPLQWAHGTVRELGGRLHHGRPVKAVSGGTFGRSCSVGFVAAEGVAFSTVLPGGGAWRWLHAVGRLHAVRLAAPPGLSKGLLLLTIYAPLQVLVQRLVVLLLAAKRVAGFGSFFQDWRSKELDGQVI